MHTSTTPHAQAKRPDDEIIGSSPAIRVVFELMSMVSHSNSNVLILGETGTGKELVARGIHQNSRRHNKKMIKINCAALPASLIESELFGHERGSFTGATERRIGKFELADNSTLFLDEIGEMPVDLQVKLLRAIQEREIERVGGTETIKVDVRIIAATSRDLHREVNEGRFRMDLFYRLNVFPIPVPPLRERHEDIPLLINHFIYKYCRANEIKIKTICPLALQKARNHPWPGNVRELEHLIERAILLTGDPTIRHLPLAEAGYAIDRHEQKEFPIKTMLENERDLIKRAVKKCNGKISGKNGAAALLGIPVSTLNSKMVRLGIVFEKKAID